jgi:hypothetical protein
MESKHRDSGLGVNILILMGVLLKGGLNCQQVGTRPHPTTFPTSRPAGLSQPLSLSFASPSPCCQRPPHVPKSIGCQRLSAFIGSSPGLWVPGSPRSASL